MTSSDIPEEIMVTVQTWAEQMSEDMRLRDFRPRTQEGYLLATRQFMDWAKRAPSRLSDEHVRGYFLYLRERWVVFAKPAVQGAEKVLDYLGRYVHRTAMSDKAIVHDSGDTVTFSYRQSSDGQRRTMALPAHELLRRFLQHVPPKGFHRIRTFGLLHPAQRETLRRLQLALAPSSSPREPGPPPPAKIALRCPHCANAALVLLRRLSPADCIERAAVLAIDPLARAPPAASPQPVMERCA